MDWVRIFQIIIDIMPLELLLHKIFNVRIPEPSERKNKQFLSRLGSHLAHGWPSLWGQSKGIKGLQPWKLHHSIPDRDACYQIMYSGQYKCELQK
jgi:hypothetical protein